MYPQRYLITGGSGLIGTQLIKQLLLESQDVTVLTRSEVNTANHFAAVMAQALNEVSNPNQHHSKVKTIRDLEQLPHDAAFDVIINLAGAGIADKRWNDEVKTTLLESRLHTTQSLFDFIKDTAVIKPEVFISGSALGFYGIEASDDAIDEAGTSDDSFSSQLCQQWEECAQQIAQLGIRTCYLRTGIVLDKHGGALAKMLPPFKFGLGGPIGSGKQWMSWIHIDDIVGIIRYAVETESLNGALNATAPEPVTNRVFSKSLGKVLMRPALLPMPAFAVKWLFGQMGEELLLAGKRVVPKKLLAHGYSFKFTELNAALKQLLK